MSDLQTQNDILATEVIRLRAELEDLLHFKAQVDSEGVVPASVMQELADTRAELAEEKRKVEVAESELKRLQLILADIRNENETI